jgi:hypothetical protein
MRTFLISIHSEMQKMLWVPQKCMKNSGKTTIMKLIRSCSLNRRLFDILIGDWDRHEDQWRWGEFEKENGVLYRPIPRDRDQAFTKFDGLIPKMITKVLPDIQSFESKIGDPAELSIAARNLRQKSAQ